MKNNFFIFAIILSTLTFIFSACNSDSSIDNSLPKSGGSTGQGGSYARFSIVGDYLYSLNYNRIFIYDISDPTNVKKTNDILISGTGQGRNAETIFHYKNNLLLGTQFGMIVYSLQIPQNPNYVGQFNHVIGCDPVVAENDIAYVTISGETGCRGTVNELNILDISYLQRPTLIKSVPMTSPRGLGIDANNLFVCDDNKVLVLNVAIPDQPQKVSEINVKNPYDVIPFNQNLILSASEGIFQYDYSNPNKLELNSIIRINK